MNTFRRILCLVLFAVLLSGCGVRTAYNNLDWLAMRWINQQINLNAEQEMMAREAIAQKLAWHCANELPAYIDFIERVDRDVASDNINRVTLDAYGEQMGEFGSRLLERARPTVIELLASLDQDQVDEIMAGIDERNDELVAETLDATPEERRQERVESMERGMRRFIGRLSREQRARLEQWAGELRSTAQFDRVRREARRQSLEQALAVRHDRAELERRIDALLEPETSGLDQPSDQYEQRSLHNRDRTLEAVVDIHRLADRRQINRLRDRLDGLADDFRRLSCQPQA